MTTHLPNACRQSPPCARLGLLVASLCAACQGSAAAVDGACAPIPGPAAWPAFPMPNPPRSGLPNPAAYEVNASGGQVIDHVTGLTWQRRIDAGSFSWDDAKTHCACLVLDGDAGWRLPSRIELGSLPDWTVANPAIDTVAFPDTPPDTFWSSSPMVEDPGLAWLVAFDAGFTSYDDAGSFHHARCVRGQPTPVLAPPARYLISNGTVVDRQTHLTWQQAEPGSLYAWGDADAYCTALTLDGSGWRMPSIGELQTIVDDTASPSADATAFPTTTTNYYWSSSRVAGDPARAWTGFFANGSTYRMEITVAEAVRCVR